MKRNTRKTFEGKYSTAFSIIAGLAASVGISFVITGGMTSLVLNGSIGAEKLDAVIFFVRALSVLVGGLLGASLRKSNMLLTIGSIACAYLIFITALGIIAFDGSVKHLAGGALSVAAGGVAGCLIRLSAQKKPRYNARKRV